MVRQRRDHRRIVGAQPWKREQQLEAVIPAAIGQRSTEATVNGNASRSTHGLDASFGGGAKRLANEHVDNRLLKARADILDTMLWVLAQKVKHGGLEAAKTEIVARVVEHAPWKLDGRGVSLLGSLLDFRAAGVTQAQQLGDLVERLASRVVGGLPKDLMFSNGRCVRKNGVPARDNKRNHRQRIGRGIHQEWRVEMRLDMVNADERFSRGEGDSFGGVETDQQ